MQVMKVVNDLQIRLSQAKSPEELEVISAIIVPVVEKKEERYSHISQNQITILKEILTAMDEKLRILQDRETDESLPATIKSLMSQANANGYGDIIKRAIQITRNSTLSYEEYLKQLFQCDPFRLAYRDFILETSINESVKKSNFEFYTRKLILQRYTHSDHDQSNNTLKLHVASDFKHAQQIKGICEEIAKKYNCQRKYFQAYRIQEMIISNEVTGGSAFFTENASQAGKFCTFYIPYGDVKLMTVIGIELELDLAKNGIHLGVLGNDGFSLRSDGSPMWTDKEIRDKILNSDGIDLPEISDSRLNSCLITFRHECSKRGFKRSIDQSVDGVCVYGYDPQTCHQQELKFHIYFTNLVNDLRTIYSTALQP